MSKRLIIFIFFVLFVGTFLFNFFDDSNLSNENLENKGEVFYIDNDISLNPSYYREFLVSNGNGDLLNISVDNVGKNDIYLIFSRKNKNILNDVVIKGKESFTKEFNSNDFKLNGKFEIYLYTMDGSKVSANINASQRYTQK